MILRVELWLDDDIPQVRIHANEAHAFTEVKAHLGVLRDRLTREIEHGDFRCPFSPYTVLAGVSARTMTTRRSKGGFEKTMSIPAEDTPTCEICYDNHTVTPVLGVSLPCPKCRRTDYDIALEAMQVRTATWPDAERHKADFMEFLATERRLAPGTALGVGGAWASRKMSKGYTPAPVAEDFITWLSASFDIEPVLITFWGLVLERGNALVSHDHIKSHLGGRNQWAGVYYLDIPECHVPDLTGAGRYLVDESAPPSGAIVFPEITIEIKQFSEPMPIVPSAHHEAVEGEALIWPAWLPHSVEPWTGGYDRISIGFSVHEPDEFHESTRRVIDVIETGGGTADEAATEGEEDADRR